MLDRGLRPRLFDRHYFDTDANDLCAAFPQGAPFTFFVVARLGGDAAANGMTGAEYRVANTDPAWFANYTPGPGSNLALGSPIDGTGANIAWPSCQAPGNHLLLLATISGFNPAPATGRVLRVQQRNPPTNPNFPCPLLTLCDAEFTKLCVVGGDAFVNLGESPCAFAVEPSSWTQIKGLYRD